MHFHRGLKHKARFCTVLAVLALSIPGFCQQLPFKVFSIDEGLIQSMVFAIFQDSKGYLWFATTAGVSRFDGNDFVSFGKEFGVSDPLVRDICETTDGTIWFATGSGLAGYDGRNLRVLDRKSGLPGDRVYSLAATENGVLWAGLRNHGVIRIIGDEIKNFPMDGSTVNTIVTDLDGRLLFGSSSGMWVLEDDEVVPYGPPSLKNQMVSSLTVDNSNHIWLGLIEGDQPGVYRWNRSNDSDLETFVEGVHANHLFHDSEGYIWASTRDDGVVRIHKNGASRYYRRKDGLPNDSINAVFQDHEGGLWFGTYGNGVARLRNENFLNYPRQDDLAEPSSYCVTQDDLGRYWVGTNGGGVSMLEDGEFTSFTTADGLPHDKVLSLLVDHRNQVWMGTLAGLSIYDGKVFRNYKESDGLSSPMIFDILEEKPGSVWMATRSGLTHYRNGAFTTIRDPLPSGVRFNTILKRPDGELWFGGRKILAYKDGQFREIQFDGSGGRLYVNDMIVDQGGAIWIAASSGLIRHRDGEDPEWFTEDQGLAHNMCKTLVEDNDQMLWIGTLQGLNRFDGNNFDRFTTKDGILSNEINRGASFKDNAGNIWFGTNRGLTLFSSNAEVTPNKMPPPIHITDFKILGDSKVMQPDLKLPWQQNFVEFGFTAIVFTAPEELTYYHMLDGFEDDWNMGGNAAIQYTNLKPGDYTFRVKAINGDGVESEAEATYSFHIIPPIWQRTWFKLMFMMVAVGLVWLAFRAQVRKERLRAEALSAIEANKAKSAFLAHMSHELRTPLNAILGYSDILEEEFRFNQDMGYAEDIRKVQFSAHHLLSLINNILDISKIDAGKMSVFFERFPTDVIVEMVRTTVTPLVRKNNNEFVIRSCDVGLIRADKAKLRQVLLNLISNAAKFTSDGIITLDISKKVEDEQEWILFRVIDNGIGMTEEELSKIFQEYTQGVHGRNAGGTGLGLVISKRFCEMMGGQLEVESEPEKGSTFTIKLPTEQEPASSLPG